jgi:uncharacterized protein
MILIRIIVFGLLIYLGIKTISWVLRLVGPARPDRQGDVAGPRLEANDMVRDPVCGVYISALDALTLRKRGGTLYFCSEECRRRYTESH